MRCPRLFALMDDEGLYARRRTTQEQDFFSLLMRFEESTGLLTRFTGDAHDISSSMASVSSTVTDALIAVTIAHYYRMTNGYDTQLGEAVGVITGGVQLTLSAINWGENESAKVKDLFRAMAAAVAPELQSWLAPEQSDRLIVSNGTALDFDDTTGRRDIVRRRGCGHDHPGKRPGLCQRRCGNDVINGGTNDPPRTPSKAAPVGYVSAEWELRC